MFKQSKITKNFLKILPYIASLLVGLTFMGIGLYLRIINEDLKDLFINVSAAFFAIPLIFLFYQTAHNYSQRRLNKEIFEYAKIQVDRDIFSIMTQLSKLIYNNKGGSPTFKDLNNLFTLKKSDIIEKIYEEKILGFKVFKNWDTMKKNLEEVLKNPYIIKRLEDEPIISIITLIKKLDSLTRIQKNNDFCIDTREKIKSHSVVNGNNSELPNRYMLLKEIKIKNKENTFIVKDFGDFYKYDVENLLNFYVINELYIQIYCDTLFYLIKEIKNWTTLTGSEIIIDPNTVRLARKKNKKK